MATPTVETKIWLALKGRIDSMVLDWPHTILWPGRIVSLPDGIGLEVTYMPNRPLRRYLASDEPSYRRGILQIGVLVKPGVSNPAYPQEIVGDVADHFPADQPMTYSDITVKVSEDPQVGGGFYDAKRNRFVTPISIRYHVEA